MTNKSQSKREREEIKRNKDKLRVTKRYRTIIREKESMGERGIERTQKKTKREKV